MLANGPAVEKLSKKEIDFVRKRLLGRNVPVEVVDSLIEAITESGGRLAWGKVKDAAMTLYSGSGKGTALHEAMHIVSLFMLTPTERTTIYAQIRRDNPDLKTDRDVEEHLADGYKEYALGRTDFRSKVIDFFARIYNLIRNLFVDRTIDNITVDKLYRAVHQGRYLNAKPLPENLKRASGVEYLLDIAGMPVDNIRVIKNMLFYQLFKTNNITSKGDLASLSFQKLFDWVKLAQSKYEQAGMKEQAAMYKDIIDNFDSFKNIIVTQLAALRLIKAVENTTVADETAVDSADNIPLDEPETPNWDKAVYEINSRDSMHADIKIFLQTIPITTGIHGPTGMPMFENFNTAWSKAMKLLSGSSNIYEMISRMKEKAAAGDQFFDYLVNGVTKVNPKTQEVTVVRPGVEQRTELFKTRFETAFKKHKHTFINAVSFLDKSIRDGQTYLSSKQNSIKLLDAALNRKANQFKSEWDTAFAEEDKFFIGTERVFKQNAAAVLVGEYDKLVNDIAAGVKGSRSTVLDYTPYLDRVASLFNKIKVDITKDTLIQLFSISGNPTEAFNTFVSKDMKFLFGMGGVLSKAVGKPFSPRMISSTAAVSKLAQAQTIIASDTMDDTIRGVKNNTYYLYSNNSYLTTAVRDRHLNLAELKARKNKAFYKHSEFLNAMLDTTRSIELATLGGLAQQKQKNGAVSYDNLDFLEFSMAQDFLVKLNAIESNLLPLPTLADKKTFYFLKGFDTIQPSELSYDLDTKSINISDAVVNRFVKYAKAERERIIITKRVVDKAIKSGNYMNLIANYHYQTVDAAGNPILKVGDKYTGNGTSHTMFKGLGTQEITTDLIRGILQKQIEKVYNFAAEQGIIEIRDTKSGTVVKSNLLGKDVISKYKDTVTKVDSGAIKAALANYTLNSLYANIEVHYAFTGDPAFYKVNQHGDYLQDYVKRTSALIAPGDAYRNDYVDGEFKNKRTYKSVTINTPKHSNKVLYDNLAASFKTHFQDLGYTAKQIEAEIKERLSGYLKVDPTDGQAFISLRMYKSLMNRLGLWDPAIHDRAYELLSNNRILTPAEEREARALVLQPLKTVFFNIEMRNGLPVPVYNKMSMAVLTPKLLKPNDPIMDVAVAMEANDIDVLNFDSAIKSGRTLGIDMFTSDGKANPAIAEPTYHTHHNFNGLLRQQVTDPHEVTERLLGTQVRKLSYLNLKLDKAVYTLDGKQVTGQEIADIITNTLSELSNKGKQSFDQKVGVVGDSVNKDKLYAAIREAAVSGNMPYFILEALQDTSLELDALPDRVWAESKMISLNTKRTIDIKTPGDGFFQVTNYGLHKLGGTDLELINKEGKTEIKVSVGLFKSVIPNYDKKTHSERAVWLRNNLSGIGYRIPTQGLNSTIAFEVVEFLPEETGNTVILPLEFTKLTGSDFDIDKLFLAVYNYDKSGNRIKFIDGDPTDSTVLQKLYQQKYKDNLFLIDELEEVLNKATANVDFGEHANNLLTNNPYARRRIKTILEDTSELQPGWDLKLITKEQLQAVIGNLKSIETFEEFSAIASEKDIYELNTKEANQNRYLDATISLYTSPAHIVDSKTPLDYYTGKLVAMADEIRDLYGEESALGTLDGLSPIFMTQSKVYYSGGKDGLGPYALSNVHHALAQISGLSIDLDFALKGEQSVTLNKILGEDNISISDWFSALISANVDIAKDPYIFFLSSHPNTWGTISFLLRAGLGDKAFWYHNIPIIRNNLEALSYPKQLTKIAEDYYKKAMQVAGKTVDKTTIREYITEFSNPARLLDLQREDFIKGVKHLIKERDGKNWKVYAAQAGILLGFQEINEASYRLNQTVLYSRVDGKGFGNSLTSLYSYDTVLQSVIDDPKIHNFDTLLSDTYLGSMYYNSVYSVMNLYSGLLVSSTEAAISSMDILRKVYGISTTKSDVADKVSREIYAAAVGTYFTSPSGMNLTPEQIRTLLRGDITKRGLGSLPERLYKLKQTHKAEIEGNSFLSSLTPVYNSEAKVWIIDTYSGDRSDPWIRDEFESEWRKALQSDNATISEFARDLLPYSFYTTGFSRRRNSFFHSMPLQLVTSALSSVPGAISFNEFIKTRKKVMNSDLALEEAVSIADNVALNNVDMLPTVSYYTPFKVGNITLVAVTDRKLKRNTGSTAYVYPKYVNLANDTAIGEFVGMREFEGAMVPVYKSRTPKGMRFNNYYFYEYGINANTSILNKTPKQDFELTAENYQEFIDAGITPVVGTSMELEQTPPNTTDTESPFLSDEALKLIQTIPMNIDLNERHKILGALRNGNMTAAQQIIEHLKNCE